MKKFNLSLLGCLFSLSPAFVQASAIQGQEMVNPTAGVVVGYWHNWCGGSGYQGGVAPCVTLEKINPHYNVVDVSFMKVHGNNPIPTFVLATETGMTEAQFIEQIGKLNSQGRAVLLALGGADAHIELRKGQEQAFADEIIRQVETYGFDGIDLDLEQTAVTAADNQTVIPAALRIVKDHYRAQGKNFLITMAPEFPYLVTGGAYIPYLEGLEGYYDWINPQFYNQGGDGLYIDGVGWIAQNNDALKEEFIYYISDSLINGTRGFYKIPHNKLVFGIPSSIDAAATGFVKEPQKLFNAFNKLSQQKQPLRGVMTWSINWDVGKNSAGQSYDSSFIKTYGPFIHDQTITPPPVESGKPVFNGITDMRIKQGTPFDVYAGVSAQDKEDGDLTSQILVEGSVNHMQMGVYSLVYKVTDSDKNTTEKARNVEVYNSKPVLTGISDTSVEIDGKFNPLAGVSASDEEDGDLTSRIKLSGQVNTSVAGQYQLTYSITDSANQTVTQTRRVTVKKQGATCENPWLASSVYVQNDEVSHNGKRWQAQWWTQNEEPGKSGEWGVWRAVGDSDCGDSTTPPTGDTSSNFTVTGINSSYPLASGQVTIGFAITTKNPVQIKAALEQSGKIYADSSALINGNGSISLKGSNLKAGSYDVVVTGAAESQANVEQRFSVNLTEQGQGGGEYPAYVSGTPYQAGDRVSNAGGNYECKPWPASGWCGAAPSHYAPGTGSAWTDAWLKI
ncbi:MAG: immunoglobulin-like domain-containing protein [Enterovibrio sp.]